MELDVHAPSPGRQALRTLFEPFGGASTDLGLFPCRALVVALGGKVGVAEGGETMTFWLWVPCQSTSDRPRDNIGRHTVECDDVLPGCPVSVEADTAEQLLGNAVNLGRPAYDLAEAPPERGDGQLRDLPREEDS